MIKYLANALFKGNLTVDDGIILTNGKNITTTNQFYVIPSTYTNGIVVGYDASAAYLGYSMGSLPIHVGTNGTGNFVVRTTGNTVIENGGLSIGQAAPEATTKFTVNGHTWLKGWLYGQGTNGGDFGLYPESGYYEFASPSGANQGPILMLNCKYTGKQVGFYAGDTSYPGMLLYEQSPSGTDIAYWALDRWAMTPSQKLVWAATAGGTNISQGPYDIGLSRDAAGVLQVNNGTVGTYASLKALNLTATGNLTVTGKGSFGDHVTINADPALFSGGTYSGYKMLGIGSTAGGGVSFVSNNGIAAEIIGDNGLTGLYLASYGVLPVITFYINTTEVGKYKTNGDLQLSNLAGTGSRMVVADATGVLGVQTIPTNSLQGAVDADKNTSSSLAVGTTTVKAVSATTYSGVFFDYVVKNGTNVRVGSVVAITNGTDIEFYETLSNDIGSTSNLTFTVTLSGGNINLNAVAAATGWTVIVSTRAI